MKHVIIGAGPAGVIAAETLRKVDPSATIMIIGEERESPYSRMALPYYLSERISEKGTLLRKLPSHYSDQRIELIQDRVTAINAATKTLSLQRDADVAYDRLLIATGSHPINPPIPGMTLPGIYPCWTLEDSRNIIKYAQPGAKVVLMGAGFIGCIILEALAGRKVDLTVIEMGDRMVPRMMDQVSGRMIKNWCLDKGVAVHTSTKIDAIEKSGLFGNKLQLTLSNGETLSADLVIAATGVRANIQFLEGSDIETDFGILVNDHMQSNQADIYAAGDVCQGRDFSTGEYSVQAIQPTAAEHGRIAALNMAGSKALHQGSINMNVLDTMGLISSSYGIWMGVDDGDSTELCDQDRYRYLNLQFEDDILVGAQALGLTQHVGVLRGLIQTKARLGKWKQRLIKDPTRIMEAYLGTTQAIGHNAGVI